MDSITGIGGNVTVKFSVKTKPGDIHLLNGRKYEVVGVLKLKSGWKVEVVRK